MKRREFITLLGGAAAWPTAVWAQQASAVRTVAMLQPLAADDPEAQLRATVVRQRLQELGWTVGRNLRIEHRWATADKSRIQSYAAEVVKLSPDVILAGTTPH